jgi:hypothetical protein
MKLDILFNSFLDKTLSLKKYHVFIATLIINTLLPIKAFLTLLFSFTILILLSTIPISTLATLSSSSTILFQ